MLTLYLALQRRLDEVKATRERGAAVIEYAGLLVIVAAIVGAIVALNLHEAIGTAVENAVNDIIQEG